MAKSKQTNQKTSIGDYIESNIEGWVKHEIMPFLRIPSISTDSKNEENKLKIKESARYLANLMNQKGIASEIIEGTNPVVYGEIGKDKDKKTLLIYGHLDVQPKNEDEKNKWDNDAFNPKIVGDKLYGRGSSDDKGQLLTHVYSVQSHLKTGRELPINLKFMFESGEENGSEGMEDFIKNYKDKINADAVVITDSNSEREGIPAILTTLRGLVGVKITVDTMDKSVHSGSYGGPTDNAVMNMIALLSQLKNPHTFEINIPSFYEGIQIFSEDERKKLNSLPSAQKNLIKELGLSRLIGEKGYTPAELLYIRPTLDVHVLSGGGESNVIPAHASAYVSMRTVPNQDPEKIYTAFEGYVRHIAKKLGIKKIDVEKRGIAYPFSIDVNGPYFEAVANAMMSAYNANEVDYAHSGASEPIAVYFQQLLKVPVIINGYGTPNDNAHGINESIPIRSPMGGILTGIRSNVLIYKNIGKIK